MEKKKEQSYATITDDGVNYRDIARTMSIMGWQMFHSSARNYVLRVMEKMVEAFCKRWNVTMTAEEIHEVAKSPLFQSGVSDLLHSMWAGEQDDTLFMSKDEQEEAAQAGTDGPPASKEDVAV